MKRVHNFYPGPGALPLEAIEYAQQELVDFQGTGMSLLEMSHRSTAYQEVHDEAFALLRELMALPDNYHIMFLQGGASLQFAMLPMN
ncbi:MAG TPA: aminotransferase class V-fold PLP-dependent enzyme, partial [bacterium]|nr:aminotransferase class V-fold PLP-dependent enzyme [bacterium]